MAPLRSTLAGWARSCIRHAGLGALHAVRLVKGANSLDEVFIPRIALSYKRYLRHRDKKFPRDFSDVRDTGQPGLVSVILPVFNGQDYIAESIESVLAQTHERFELIIVNDGSTDATPGILETYANRDARVTVIRQVNQKLPAALNTGFRQASGQYLTWTSHDNRMKPDCLAQMVKYMDRRPDVDMVYANYEIIGEDGRLIEGASFCENLQQPPGSGIINLPADVSVIQYINGNFIGPAFIYRRRVLDLVGDYSTHWFTCEDYDYFLRVNEQMKLRRLDSDDSIYQYRLHRASLSAAGGELGIDARTEALMIFDDHRRDISIGPVAWLLCVSSNTIASPRFIRKFESLIRRNGDFNTKSGDPSHYEAIPGVFFHVMDYPDAARQAPDCDKSSYDLCVLIWVDAPELPRDVHPDWDLCLTNVDGIFPLPKLSGHRRGWLSFKDVSTCLHMVRLRALSDKMTAEENVACEPPKSSLDLSVIICTSRGGRQLQGLLDSLQGQTLSSDRYELIIVNNDPGNREEAGRIEKACEGVHPLPEGVRVIECLPRGLSRARNAGLAQARGEVVLFLDDDAVADSHLFEKILASYHMDEALGVAGGMIDLELPDPAPVWMSESLWPYWSHYHPEGDSGSSLDDWKTFPYGANWSARRDGLLAIGGFRTAYGRNGTLVDAGEETVAAMLMQKAGYKVAAVAGARVTHKVDRTRFTLHNLLRTVRGGYDIAIQQELDHYVAFELSPLGLLVHGVKRLGRMLRPFRSPLSQRVQDFAIMAGCFHCALQLMRIQLGRFGK